MLFTAFRILLSVILARMVVFAARVAWAYISGFVSSFRQEWKSLDKATVSEQ